MEEASPGAVDLMCDETPEAFAEAEAMAAAGAWQQKAEAWLEQSPVLREDNDEWLAAAEAFVDTMKEPHPERDQASGERGPTAGLSVVDFDVGATDSQPRVPLIKDGVDAGRRDAALLVGAVARASLGQSEEDAAQFGATDPRSSLIGMMTELRDLRTQLDVDGSAGVALPVCVCRCAYCTCLSSAIAVGLAVIVSCDI